MMLASKIEKLAQLKVLVSVKVNVKGYIYREREIFGILIDLIKKLLI